MYLHMLNDLTENEERMVQIKVNGKDVDYIKKIETDNVLILNLNVNIESCSILDYFKKKGINIYAKISPNV